MMICHYTMQIVHYYTYRERDVLLSADSCCFNFALTHCSIHLIALLSFLCAEQITMSLQKKMSVDHFIYLSYQMFDEKKNHRTIYLFEPKLEIS